MTKAVKYTRIMWKQRGSHGPDVEMILYMPIAIAVESKPTVDVALKEIGQVIKYARSEMYDAVLVRLENPPRTNSPELRTLIDVAKQHGVGIVLGGETYAPLTGFEQVIVRAPLRLHGNPVALYQKRWKMKIVSKDVSDIEEQLKDLSNFRKYFLSKSEYGG